MEEKKFQILHVYPPGPKTERGQGTTLNIVKKRLVYGSSNLVIIRNYDTLEECEFYSGHREQVTCAKFSHNGNWVCSADARGNIHIWDALGKDHVARYVYENYMPGNVKDLCWTSDNQRIIAVGEGKEVYAKAFLVESGSKVGDITMNGKQLITCDVRIPRPFRLAMAGEEFNTNWYEGPPYKWKNTQKFHTSFVNCLRFSPDGQYYVTVSSDRKIVMYDGKEGSMIQEFKDSHTGGIWYCDWVSDKLLATCSGDKSVKLWEIVEKENEKPELNLINQLTVGSQKITDQQVSIQHCEENLISLSLGGQFNLFQDIKNSKNPSQVIEQHQNIVTQMVFANGKLVSGDKSGKILIHEGKSAQLIQGEQHTKEISKITLSPDLKFAYSLCRKGEIKQISLDQHIFEKSISFDKLVVTIQGGLDNQIYVLLENEIQVLKDLQLISKIPFEGLPDPSSMQFCEKKGLIAIGNQRGKIKVINVEGKQVYEVAHQQSKITALEFSEKYLYSGDSSGKIIVWDKMTGEQKTNRWSYHSQMVQKIEISNQWVISGGLDNKLIIWNEESLEKVDDFSNIHSQLLYNFCLDKKNSQIFTSGSDWMIKQIQSPYILQ